MSDTRAAANRRLAPRGGHGNADPQQRRAVLVDLRDIAEFNRGTTRAKAAYARHPFRTDAEHRARCLNGCGTSTGRPLGLCLKCEQAAQPSTQPEGS